MAYTMQQVIDRARFPLNDENKVRNPDDECLLYAIDGLLTIRDKRPDLFIGNWAVDLSALTLVSVFPLADTYAPAVQDYIIFRAELKDDEHVNSNRSSQSLNFFAGRI